ncbi:hypothetical protein IWW37_003526 [Coemansia sp. RSA 2050]|nr:hypothetical protein IWW37_003526 [Coemansia sp. RSA 2050]KAJ2732936.1 hypothetical protein IW152_003430 [Coemansia sp. BCRC 34962]
MDYRAAATRQLKEGATAVPGTAATTKKVTAASPAPAPTEQAKPNVGGSPVVLPPTDSPKMKAIHSGRAGGGVGNNANSNGHGARKAASGSPLSYAATAASKKTVAAVATTATTGGNGGESGAMGKKGPVRQTSSPSMPLTMLVGARIRVTPTSGSDIEGLVYTYDVYSGVVALISALASDDLPDLQNIAGASPSVGGGRQRAQIHLVKAANIKAVEVLAQADATDGEKKDSFVMPEVRAVDTSVVEARKQRALIQAQERAQRIGVGVSDKAQSIFEALSRTLPCRWDRDSIIVLDEVSIEPPYSVDSCRELQPASFSLQRVKKVLQGELSRLDRVAASA